jgi:ABC-type molybdate transport system permease subunit
VALAAIQGLNEIVAEQDAQIEALEARVAELEETESSSNSETATSSLLPWILVGVLAGALLGTVACFLGLVIPLRKRLLDATQP